MKPAISVVTLGVKNLGESVRFYRDKIGLATSATEKDDIAFFEMNGMILALFERESLAEDASVASSGSGFHGFTLAQNTVSEAEVDSTFARLRERGVRIVKEPRKAPWGGYSGYFTDPDDFLWEIAYNPGWKVDEAGRVYL